ncbi:hypothetical protein HN51_004226 [Arachis hypogaea]
MHVISRYSVVSIAEHCLVRLNSKMKTEIDLISTPSTEILKNFQHSLLVVSIVVVTNEVVPVIPMVDSMMEEVRVDSAVVDTTDNSPLVEVDTTVSIVVGSTVDTVVVVGVDSMAVMVVVVRAGVVVDVAGVVVVHQMDRPKLCRIQSNDHQTLFYTR